MKWNLTLSGTIDECRAQLNDAVHGLAVHNSENAAKRAVAHYVAESTLDPAFKKHMTAVDNNTKQEFSLLERHTAEDAAKIAGPQPTLSISIAIDVSAS